MNIVHSEMFLKKQSIISVFYQVGIGGNMTAICAFSNIISMSDVGKRGLAKHVKTMKKMHVDLANKTTFKLISSKCFDLANKTTLKLINSKCFFLTRTVM